MKRFFPHPNWLSLASTVAFALLLCGVDGAEADFHVVEFDTTDGGHIHASLFEGQKKRAVLLAHGAIFNKESWYPLASRLQKEGLTSLSIDFRGYGQSTAPRASAKYFDILGAIAFLKGRGYSSIALVGGSMGAATVLDALSHSSDEIIGKSIILAAPGGLPIESRKIEKLFIVSEGDPVAPRLKSIYEKSAEPKRLQVLPGQAHAQHIFKTEQASALTELIAEFLR